MVSNRAMSTRCQLDIYENPWCIIRPDVPEPTVRQWPSCDVVDIVLLCTTICSIAYIYNINQYSIRQYIRERESMNTYK